VWGGTCTERYVGGDLGVARQPKVGAGAGRASHAQYQGLECNEP